MSIHLGSPIITLNEWLIKKVLENKSTGCSHQLYIDTRARLLLPLTNHCRRVNSSELGAVIGCIFWHHWGARLLPPLTSDSLKGCGRVNPLGLDAVIGCIFRHLGSPTITLLNEKLIKGVPESKSTGTSLRPECGHWLYISICQRG